MSPPPFNITRVTAIIISVATFWVFSEWLFFVTKPSFMSLYSSLEIAGTLFGSAFVISCLFFLGSLPFVLLGWLLNKLTRHAFLVSIVVFLPASCLLVTTWLLLIDNFTMTLVGWGIRDTLHAGIWNGEDMTLSRLLSE